MIAYELDSVSTDFTDVNQILESLQKNYKKDFPEVKTMKYYTSLGLFTKLSNALQQT